MSRTFRGLPLFAVISADSSPDTLRNGRRSGPTARIKRLRPSPRSRARTLRKNPISRVDCRRSICIYEQVSLPLPADPAKARVGKPGGDRRDSSGGPRAPVPPIASSGTGNQPGKDVPATGWRRLWRQTATAPRFSLLTIVDQNSAAIRTCYDRIAPATSPLSGYPAGSNQRPQ